ncbi:MAG: UvrD-helicase domain-containing protein [Muribaculaceae bacterium]
MLTIYKASAGSGKTYTLAYQYIKLLLGKKCGKHKYVLNSMRYLEPLHLEPNRRPHSHILAITFTNKATQEMKSRILKELDDLALVPAEGEKDVSSYAKDLVSEFGCSREELARQARKALNDILFDYGAFNVSTIDSFFQMVLRVFADDIGFQGDYRVDLDNELVLHTAVDTLFEELNAVDSPYHKVLSRWFKGLAQDEQYTDKSVNPFSRSRGLYKELMAQVSKIYDEVFESHAAEVKEYLSNPDNLAAYRQRIDAKLQELREELHATAVEVASQITTGNCKWSGTYKAVPALIELTKQPPSPKDNFYKRFDASNSLKAVVGPNPAKDPDKTVPTWFLKAHPATIDVIDAMKSWISALYNHVVYTSIANALKIGLNTITISNHIDEIISKARTQDNMMLLDDTKSLLSTIINEDPIPFIYERIGVTLRHFLIDEFQDTSKMQWQNLAPLLSESLATDCDSLIIGDVKQSIYSWRGANSSLLHHQVQESAEFANKLILKGSQPGENTNYRSAHALVLFNNTLFRRIAEFPNPSEQPVTGYESIEQMPAEKNEDLSAYITINSFFNSDSLLRLYSQEELDAVIAQRHCPVAQAKERAVFHCAMQILDQMRRGYKAKDIAILCRRRDGAAFVIEYLQNYFKEIHLLSEDALFIRNNESVKLIISFLELIAKRFTVSPLSYANTDNPADSAELSAFVHERTSSALCYRYEYFRSANKLTNPTEEQVNQANNDALLHALNFDADAIPVPGTGVASISADVEAILRIGAENLSTLVEAIIKHKIKPEQQARDIDYINAFADLVNQFSLDNPATPYTFMEYWNKSGRNSTLMASAALDAVNVLTVHKAKGLEWDCVHIPLMNWEFEKEKISNWFTLRTDPADTITPPIIYLTATNEFAHELSPVADEYKRFYAAEMADNLNVAYVAFTRAVRELNIGIGVGTKAESSSNLATKVFNAIRCHAPQVMSELHCDLRAGIVSEEFESYQYSVGEPTFPVEEKSKQARRPVEPVSAEDGDIRVTATDFPVNFSEVNRVYTMLEDMVSAPEKFLDLGNNESQQIVDTAATKEARRRGIDLHLILSNIHLITEPDFLQRALALSHRYLSPGAPIEDYKREILEALDSLDPHLRELWFGAGVKRVQCEQEYYVPDGDRCFRLDRVVFTHTDGIHLIDFKFTSKPHKEHREQVNNYRHIMQRIGYRNIHAHLWYPALRQVITLPD